MRYFILFFLGFTSFASISQDFTESRITPMLSAHKELMKVYPVSSKKSWECPPNLVQNQIQTFDFLDSLPMNTNYDEKYFSAFLTNGCADYYEVMFTYQLFLQHYSTALKKFELSEKYALLPLTVSANNPSLKYLDDKSGAWQLSFVTARKYGLTINRWYDERNDIQKSSVAAAAYLHFLKEYYLNNELLIVTAFYTSVPFVNKQLQQLESPNPQEFIDSLPSEIKGYLWYLRAWSNWNENFDTSPTKVSVSKTNNWTEVQTKDTLNFEVISDFMGISVLELKMMNPVLVGETVLPNALHPFYLPKDKALVFNDKYDEFILFQKAEEERKKKELAELKKRMESGIPDLNKYKAVTYTVRSGDVLGKIADRNNVKVSSIKQWNNLKSDIIHVNQRLQLPREGIDRIDPLYAAAAVELQKMQDKLVAPTRINHRIRSGESLSTIARRYHVRVSDIQRWNGMGHSSAIKPGQVLKLRKTNRVAKKKSRVVKKKNQPAAKRKRVVTLRKGDNLWRISRRYQVSVADLERWNNLHSKTILQPGQRLVLY